MLPIHIITLAQNAEPFIEKHLSIFEKLPMPWTWSVSEGVVGAIDFQGTGKPKITSEMHKDGLSNDGTHEYLESIKHHPLVRVYADQNVYLTQRCQKMLSSFARTGQCVALQADADEIWSVEQITTLSKMFEDYPARKSARFYCRFFVGHDRCLKIQPGAGNADWDWWRAFRWCPGCEYVRHDFPKVMFEGKDLAENSFTREETKAAGLVINHFAFWDEEQVNFKVTRYGWDGALDGWRRLQTAKLPVDIHDYLPWLGHGQVEQAPKEYYFK